MPAITQRVMWLKGIISREKGNYFGNFWYVFFVLTFLKCDKQVLVSHHVLPLLVVSFSASLWFPGSRFLEKSGIYKPYTCQLILLLESASEISQLPSSFADDAVREISIKPLHAARQGICWIFNTFSILRLGSLNLHSSSEFTLVECRTFCMTKKKVLRCKQAANKYSL